MHRQPRGITLLHQFTIAFAQLRHAIDQGAAVKFVEMVKLLDGHIGQTIEHVGIEGHDCPLVLLAELEHFVTNDATCPGEKIRVRLILAEFAPQHQIGFLKYVLGVGRSGQQGTGIKIEPPLMACIKRHELLDLLDFDGFGKLSCIH